ncbi:MAG: hypothetical protein EAZ07_01960 [Cytophagales bacterium]|nr:MAG: hypothetical protein EAZ07_01960 [Cytophagales bacterium]
MNYKKLYIELGKLLYAIAKVDGVVQESEKKALREIVKNELAPLESSIDKFGSDQAFYTEFEFETLEMNNTPYKAALNSWINYARTHADVFNDQTIKLVFDAVKQIANAYRGTSKVEEELIDILNEEFKNIKKSNLAK